MIDTTGFFAGTFALKLVDTTFDQSSELLLTPGDSRGLTLDPGATADFTITNGSINIVPEPAVLAQWLALLGMGGIGLFFRRWKQRVG